MKITQNYIDTILTVIWVQKTVLEAQKIQFFSPNFHLKALFHPVIRHF